MNLCRCINATTLLATAMRRSQHGYCCRQPAMAAVALVPALYTSVRCCSSNSTNISNKNSASMGKGNFFAFFDFVKEPVLDGAALQKRYHDLQRRVHPDQERVQQREREEEQEQENASASTESAAAAAESSAEVHADVSVYANSAYETLRDPFLRCRYLSRLQKYEAEKGAPLSPAEEEALLVEDDARAMQQRATTTPMQPLSEEFLMELLAMNELIFAGDREDKATRDQMQVLLADLEERYADYFHNAQKAWTAGDMDRFHAIVQEWTYINNARTHLKDRL